MTVPGSASAWSVPPPDPLPKSRKRLLLLCGVVLAAIVIGVVAVVFLVSAALKNGNAVVDASAGRIEGFHAFSSGPNTTITFVAARGIDLPAGPGLACDVVRPVLARTDWAQARWTITNRAGDVIASNQTPCP